MSVALLPASLSRKSRFALPGGFVRGFVVPVLCLLATACASLQRVPAKGEILGHSLDTTVDSPIAKYYLENYLSGQKNEPKLDAVLDNLKQQTAGPLPPASQVQKLSMQSSVDTMALFYANRLLKDPQNQQLQASFEQEVAGLESKPLTPDFASLSQEQNYIVIFAPGWLYRSKPWTGADFARPRAMLTRMGIENHLIETEDNGTVEDNAAQIAQALRSYLKQDRPIIIISGSKGGPEVAMALGALLTPAETSPIKAWINICGSLQGSPLSNYWLSWPNRIIPIIYWRARGWGSLEGLASLDTERSRKRAAQLRIPPNIFVVNYVGVPVSGNIRDTTKGFTYVKLRRFGPNDGLVLIPDEIEPSGLTVTELGRGHFLRDADFDVRTTALLRTVTRRLKIRDHGPMPMKISYPPGAHN